MDTEMNSAQVSAQVSVNAYNNFLLKN